jgi:hypothetical protein
VNADTRLAEIITALEAVGLSCLVMGGHAARYYGLSRNTADYDLHLSPESWDSLAGGLARSPLFGGQLPPEGASWRPRDFRRFQIGRLADGREEWLEFWRHNHLLPPYSELFARHEEGTYGGRVLAFLSLPDLIRSKETERNSDWQDVAILEEFLDSRLLAQVAGEATPLGSALAHLRSQRGFARYLEQGLLQNAAEVQQALARSRLPVTQAFLLPFVPDIRDLPAPTVAIEPVILARLRTLTPASPLHLALVEAVRRHYKLALQAADRADKQAVRAAQGTSPPPQP